MNDSTMTAALPARWVRSSRCNPRNNCVELCLGEHLVGVRDSKHATEALSFTRDQWATFLSRCVSV